MGGQLSISLGLSLAIVLPLPALHLPPALPRQKLYASDGISGFTFQSPMKADLGREGEARGGLSYVFDSDVPEEVLRGWTTGVEGLLDHPCSSASLFSPVCTVFLT